VRGKLVLGTWDLAIARCVTGESTVRHRGIEVDDALELSDQTEI
jgi:hypothetical protein